MTKIKPNDMFHGAALAQITKHETFKALNKMDDGKYGHYLVNNNIRLLTKHREGDLPLQFTFQPDDIVTLSEDVASNCASFLILVCGEFTICMIDENQIPQLLDLNDHSQQWIRVTMPGSSMKVNGSNGAVKKTIAHNWFPAKLFE